MLENKRASIDVCNRAVSMQSSQLIQRLTIPVIQKRELPQQRQQQNGHEVLVKRFINNSKALVILIIFLLS
jgi:hypothetical protein